jgi:hypothetical protein
MLFLLSPANVHDGPFARPLLENAARLFHIGPRCIRLDAGYWGLTLIAWIHTVLGAVAGIPWNPKRQKRRDGLPPTWTAEGLGKHTSIERFFGRVMVIFRLQRPSVFGWSAVETRVALTYAAVWTLPWLSGRQDIHSSSAGRASCWRMPGTAWRHEVRLPANWSWRSHGMWAPAMTVRHHRVAVQIDWHEAASG